MPGRSPRVFISYSHDSPAHEERVLVLSNRLRAEGIDAEIDRYEEAPPDGWPLWMRRQVDDADFVLCICTETYTRRFGGEEAAGVGLGARWEGHIVRQALYEAGAENNKFVPILLKEATPAHIPTELAGTTHYRMTHEAGYEQLYRRLTGQPEIQRPPLGSLRSVPPRAASPTSWFAVPLPRNPHFVGRDEHLAALLPQAGVPSWSAIVGMGGVGKSQLALEHAFRVRDRRRAVLWTAAATAGDVESGFANLARTLELAGPSDTPELAVEAMREWLAHNEDWLLIFDNVEAETRIATWLPAPELCGQVVLTTRHAGLARDAGLIHLPLQPLTVDDTIEYILRRLGRERTIEIVAAATELHEELGGLPLALAQATSSIEQGSTSVRAYVEEIRRSRRRVLERGHAGADYSESVATTFGVSLQQLVDRNHDAAEVLALTVGLAPEPIPLELLIGGHGALGGQLETALAGAVEDPAVVWKLLSPLRDLSLAVVDPDLETVTVHRLIRDAIRADMSDADIAIWETRAVRALDKTFPVANYLNWPLCDRFLPHARIASDVIERRGLGWDDSHHLLNEAASYLRMRGEYGAAERMHLQAISDAERRWGPDHPRISTNYNNISFVYSDRFEFGPAIEWMRRAIAAAGTSIGWEAIAVQSANLAGLYFYAGRAAEAATTCETAAVSIEGHLDGSPPLIAHVRTVQSLVAAELGHGERAERLALEAGRLREPYANDEYTARTEIALGLARLAKRDLPGALAALNAAVDRRTRIYGPGHSLLAAPLRFRSQVRAHLGDRLGSTDDATRAAAIRDAARVA